MRFAAGGLVVLLLAALAARWLANDYLFFAAFVVLQFVVLATAWNILGGYGGYVNFGTGAFVATGAYAAVALQKLADLPLPLLVLAGTAAGAVLGSALGLLTLRLRGIYFAIATLAITIILETVVLNWDYVGGARGITLDRPHEDPFFGTYNRMLVVLMAGMAVVAVGIARWVGVSAFGRALSAIRDSEDAAEACGVPTLRRKVQAATLSGAMMGAAGAPLPLYLSFVDHTAAFGLNYAVSAMAMPMIGGTGHWIGPVIGAVLLGTAQQAVTVTISSEVNVLITGLLLIGFVVAAPRGILGWLGR
ncbi:branched-chain amino acid ABC transporter permease [Roseomonas sp. KE2513]|uniref:branched-chain amino acid ABC transporter permease n=1 Tax=Roseomonas sp. KE2513 TaxID=2479202 RepID=UPI0018DF2767|nr:branched-chain amino acid ABC transporter permease [Roseomonas sp. KE2513]